MKTLKDKDLVYIVQKNRYCLTDNGMTLATRLFENKLDVKPPLKSATNNDNDDLDIDDLIITQSSQNEQTQQPLKLPEHQFATLPFDYLNSEGKIVTRKNDAHVDIADGRCLFKIQYSYTNRNHPFAAKVLNKEYLHSLNLVKGFLAELNSPEESTNSKFRELTRMAPPSLARHDRAPPKLSSSYHANNAAYIAQPINMIIEEKNDSNSHLESFPKFSKPTSTSSSSGYPDLEPRRNIRVLELTEPIFTDPEKPLLKKQKKTSNPASSTASENRPFIIPSSTKFNPILYAFGIPQPKTTPLIIEAAPREMKPLVLRAGSYDVCLVIDNREIRGTTDRSFVTDLLISKGVKVCQIALPVGDMAWIARPKGDHGGEEEEAFLLDYIVERKSASDLAASIIDQRYVEQKFRLKSSGIKNVIYLCEELNLVEESERMKCNGLEAFRTAMSQCQVLSNFSLKRVAGPEESVAYLALMTAYLMKMMQGKDLMAIPPEFIDQDYARVRSVWESKFNEGKRVVEKIEFLQTFEKFHGQNNKTKNLTRKDIWTRQLITFNGMSAEKASFIADKFPTLKRLMDAYRRCGTEKEKELLLTTLGGAGRREIGNALSKKVWIVLGSDSY